MFSSFGIVMLKKWLNISKSQLNILHLVMMGSNLYQICKVQGTHDSPWGCLNIFFSKAWNAWKSTCPNINPTRSWINQTTSVQVHHFLGDLEVQFWTNNFVHIIICHFGSPQLPYIHPIPHWRQPTLWYLGGSTWWKNRKDDLCFHHVKWDDRKVGCTEGNTMRDDLSIIHWTNSLSNWLCASSNSGMLVV